YEEFYQLNVEDWEEIILWFEYDLFCQLNMLGLLSLLNEKKKSSETRISLICVGREENRDRLIGLGEIEALDYPSLFEQRKELSAEDLSYAANIWELYSSGQQELLFKENLDHPSLPYIKEALLAHLMRFPQRKSGLTEIETFILEELYHHPQTKHALIGKLLSRENFYGFGDLQYANMIDNLAMLYQEGADVLHLNELGKKLIEGKENFRFYRKKVPRYGQNSLLDYVQRQGKLIRV
ncbi:MAG: hypothetical protein AAF696_33520, partial [Bacteroidota bacterium]